MALSQVLTLPLQLLGCLPLAAIVLAALRYAKKRAGVAAKRARCAGQVAIVTGGSSGIGLAIAHRLAAKGMKLVLAARGESLLAAAAKELSAAGAEVHVVPTDICDAAACEALVAATLERFGRVDLCVACAGIGHHGFHEADTIELQRNLLEVNHFGTVNTLRAVVPSLVKFDGELFVMGSVSGVVGSPLRTAYCASKFATMGYIESLRLELQVSHLLIYQSPACFTEMLTILTAQMLGTPLPITVCMPGSVSKNDEFCIKNDEFCTTNEESCIKNEEFCIKNDEICRSTRPSASTPSARAQT